MVMAKNAVNVENINLFGITITTNQILKMRKVYRLRLRAILPQGCIAVNLKIAFVDAEKDDLGNYLYKAVFRKLSEVQVAVLKEIAVNYMDAELITPITLSATILR